MPIDDQHMDVLLSIEFAVIRVYEEYPEMTDYAVERTYEALIDAYAAEKLGRPPREW